MSAQDRPFTTSITLDPTPVENTSFFCEALACFLSRLDNGLDSVVGVVLSPENKLAPEFEVLLVPPKLKVDGKSAADDIIDNDIILLWADERRVITGADILGRLMRGITYRD